MKNKNPSHSFTGGNATMGASAVPMGQSKLATSNVSHGKSKNIAAPIKKLDPGGAGQRPVGECFKMSPATGTFNIDFPIHITPGRSEFQPSLALSYSSSSGNGVFGIGWQLGIGAISRSTAHRTPTYGEDDVFVLSGSEELVLSSQDEGPRQINGFTVHEYQPRVITTPIRIERWTRILDQSDIHWRTITAENITSIYGQTDISQLVDSDTTGSPRVFSWLLCESFDSWGNVIHYEYKAENSDDIGSQADFVQTCEASRSSVLRTRFKYLKSIKYGNKEPNRSIKDWEVSPYLGEFHFNIIFDYGEHDMESPTPDEIQPWTYRKDSFSTYNVGFEMRYHRLCRRILMFHHFPDELEVEDYLVRSLSLNYYENHSGSFLISLTESGHSRKQSWYGTPLVETISTAPHEFEYVETDFSGDIPIQQLDSRSLVGLLGGTNNNTQWVDLYGEGSAGLLKEFEGGAWTYQRNEKCMDDTPINFLGPKSTVLSNPSYGLNGRHYFDDIDRDGRMELVCIDDNGKIQGYYRFRNRGDREFRDFIKFKSAPNIDLTNSNIKRIDLTGNGLSDLLLQDSLSNDLLWYESLGPVGFSPARRIKRSQTSPQLVTGDKLREVYLADMTGDGLADIVHISPGRVSYWPNLSQGVFGSEVVMYNAPQLDDQAHFSHSRIRLCNIDGNGGTDLLYFPQKGGVQLYHNYLGNGWSEPTEISSFPKIHSMDKVFTTDLLGNGTTCLCWTSQLSNDPEFRFIDLAMGQKPHMLKGYTNGVGGRVDVSYKSSNWFYHHDERAGKPWRTKIGFPVQVVSQIQITDLIQDTSFCSQFAYHDGYFDRVENEFRGFGMVEQFELEIFQIGGPGEFRGPPVHTKTWYHTGDVTVVDDKKLPDAHAESFSHSLKLPQKVDASEFPSIYRAVKGRVKRVETFGSENFSKASIPYEIAESNYEIERVQHPAEKSPGTYRVIPRELVTHLDLWGDQPRRVHELTLSVDEFNNVLSSVTIHYGKQDYHLTENPPKEQRHTIVSLTENNFTNAINTHDYYHAPILSSSCQFRLVGATLTREGIMRFEQVRKLILDAQRQDCTLEMDQLEKATHPILVKIGEDRSYYMSTDLNYQLPLGTLEPYSIVHESFKLFVTRELLESLYGRPPGPENLDDWTGEMTRAGYRDIENDGRWWQPSCRYMYGECNMNLLEAAQSSFYCPTVVIEPFGNGYETVMDKYWLLPVRTIDPLSNITTAVNNYAHLKPSEITDMNGNRQRFLFDHFGRVLFTGQMGREDELVGDALDEFDPALWSATMASFLHSPTPILAKKLLGRAGECYLYQMERFHTSKDSDNPQPSFIVNLSRKYHASEGHEDDEVMIQFSYLDSSGRIFQETSLARVGVDGLEWHISESTLRNNQGSTVRTFPPRFAQSHEYSNLKQQSLATTTIYDSLGRIIGTLNPNHSFSKKRFGTWGEIQYDESDTVMISDPSQDEDLGSFFRNIDKKSYLPTWLQSRTTYSKQTPPTMLQSLRKLGAVKSTEYANTPTEVHFDSLGRPILEVKDNGARKINTRTVYDLAGNISKKMDGSGRVVEILRYDLLGRLVVRSGMDDGVRWYFPDCMNNTVLQWNSNLYCTRMKYDALNREDTVWLSKNRNPAKLIKRTIYGEKETDIDSSRRNLRGQISRIYDQSGLQTNVSFDFKGNCSETKTRFAEEYKDIIDWSSDHKLIEGEFRNLTLFDALNRPVYSCDAANIITKRRYDLLGNIYSESSQSPNESDWKSLIVSTSYTPDGQMASIRYGNNVLVEMKYALESRYLINRKIIRGENKVIENKYFGYDVAGQLCDSVDEAQQTFYFHNGLIKPSFDYKYDAIGQLVAAQGREYLNVSKGGVRACQPYQRFGRGSQVGIPGNGQRLCRYKEAYVYDDAGNILKIKHGATEDTTVSGWTKEYFYSEQSLLDSSQLCNRLSRTKTGKLSENYHYNEESKISGSISSGSRYGYLQWDFANQLKSFSTQKVKNCCPETTWYVYNSSGTRVRKITERLVREGTSSNPTKLKETLYVGRSKIQRRYSGNGIGIKKEIIWSDIEGTDRMAAIEIGLAESLLRYKMNQNLELDHAGHIISYQEYSPFGAITFSICRSKCDAPRKYRFAGYDKDCETGLYYCNARYYAAWLGRWISCDPIGTADGLNVYCYVKNNPINFVDPSGTNIFSLSHPKKTQVAPTQFGLLGDGNHKSGLHVNGPHEPAKLVKTKSQGKAKACAPKQNQVKNEPKAGTLEIVEIYQHKQLMKTIGGQGFHQLVFGMLRDQRENEITPTENLSEPSTKHTPELSNKKGSGNCFSNLFRFKKTQTNKVSTAALFKEVSTKVDEFLKDAGKMS
ncbi:hypothetical protein TWF694_006065 [Orbilia ellipsospora]|uniref:Uncharacterized protein n=1 Tax=Orbilia ellipsospora TaxID=2528407 RepID=A0AAV9WR32_9PEZI